MCVVDFYTSSLCTHLTRIVLIGLLQTVVRRLAQHLQTEQAPPVIGYHLAPIAGGPSRALVRPRIAETAIFGMLAAVSGTQRGGANPQVRVTQSLRGGPAKSRRRGLRIATTNKPLSTNMQ